MNRWMLAALTMCALTASAGDNFEPQAAVRVQLLGAQLKAALQGSMAAGGPVAAIDTCQLQAPAIAAGLTESGWSVGRTSERLRNPANKPSPELMALLREYAANSELPARATLLEDGSKLYVSPIKVGPLCLNCHGTELQPEVQRQLSLRYPEDQATGYQAGDFRGLFWVRYQPQ
ncbi:DUF3365 domain-containing protein [Pseudomaricurvus sp. HS19]|uniref:Tll0287-like domain-containing protein n=1 Tax=Pseudomaricurvus sp. HS19 TaxID=2692626 RepID=UPI00136BE17A|nr:DUF3365 domain-containing protein [Pseudomaricurvus sp. HS19]MYM63293.1 DUF3365 domain-containing protein [Pseudomaricurvus sp. HS19]